jgi:enoyl-CoA hydratase/carnithine racemase
MKAVLGLILIAIGLLCAWGGVTGRLPKMIDALGSA